MPPTSRPMLYAEYEPAAELKAWVECHWTFQVDPDAGPSIPHVVPPDGTVSIAYHARFHGAALSGPFLEPARHQVAGGDRFWGCRFWPGAAPCLLDLDPSALRNRILGPGDWPRGAWLSEVAADLDGIESAEDALAALDGAIARLVPAARPLDGVVMQAVFRIIRAGGREPIRSVADAVGLSPRQLRRRFSRATGLTPKEYARLRRARAAAVDAVAAEPETWVALAAEHGYADQAHLGREFRRLVGLSPARFSERLRRIEHHLLEP